MFQCTDYKIANFQLPNLNVFLATGSGTAEQIGFEFVMPKVKLIQLKHLGYISLFTSESLQHIHLRDTAVNIISRKTIYPKIVTMIFSRFFGGEICVPQFKDHLSGNLHFQDTKFLYTNAMITTFKLSDWKNLEVLFYMTQHYDFMNPGACCITIPELPLLRTLGFALSVLPRPNLNISVPLTDVHFFHIESIGSGPWFHEAEQWIHSQTDPHYIFETIGFHTLRKHYVGQLTETNLTKRQKKSSKLFLEENLFSLFRLPGTRTVTPERAALLMAIVEADDVPGNVEPLKACLHSMYQKGLLFRQNDSFSLIN